MILVLSGCSSGNTTERSEKGFNDADVTFATDMIQHHAQALQMVDLTMGRDLSPEVQALAEEIRAAQAPEIETMASWLQVWGQPVPATVRDHANAHGGGMDMESDVPGMMSPEDMQTLQDASDANFQRMWLAMMIEHHHGAITMAEEEKTNGQHRQSIALAENIVVSQTDEIDAMTALAR